MRELKGFPFSSGIEAFPIKNAVYVFLIRNALSSGRNMKQLSLLKFAQLHQPEPADVAALADDVIEELDLTPPIDPRIVASYLGISRIEESEIDVAGCLICDGQDITIKVRSSDFFARRRFTIFHECTHTFFKGFERQPQYRCAPSVVPFTDPGLEALCDLGAGALLLPRRFVRRDLEEADFGIATLRQMSETYEASLEATGHRIVDLAPEDTLFVVLEVGLKPRQRGQADAEPRLRVRTARGRGGWPFIPRDKSVSTDSPLGRALQGEVVNERTVLDEITRVPVPNVEVSARLLPYAGRNRVLALYRRSRE